MQIVFVLFVGMKKGCCMAWHGTALLLLLPLCLLRGKFVYENSHKLLVIHWQLTNNDDNDRCRRLLLRSNDLLLASQDRCFGCLMPIRYSVFHESIDCMVNSPIEFYKSKTCPVAVAVSRLCVVEQNKTKNMNIRNQLVAS